VQLLGVAALFFAGCLAAGAKPSSNPAVSGAEVLAEAKGAPEPGSAELLLAGALLLASAAIGRKMRKSSDPSSETKEP
jgi:hypothetical protein